MTAKKNLLVLCLLSASGVLSPIANSFELVNVPEAPSYSPEEPGPDSSGSRSCNHLGVKTSSDSPNIDMRSLEREGAEKVVWGRVPSCSPSFVKGGAATSASPMRHTNTVVLQEVGVADSVTVSSFGKDVPFNTALHLILPEDWVINVSESLRKSEHTVSWRKGEDQKMAIIRVLNNHPGVRSGRINWDSKTLSVFDRPMSTGGQTIWCASSGKSLRSTLSEWAAFEGWTLEWDSKLDFVLGESTRYQGSLVEATEQLVGATSRANKIVDVDFCEQNRVIQVTERKGARL